MSERVDMKTGEILPPRLDDRGREVPDPRPMQIPAGFKRPETLAEQVQRLVRTTISRRAQEEGFETFEESEDFDVDDDVDPSTPYETFFDPVLGQEITPAEFREHEAIYRKRYLEAQREYFASLDRQEVLTRTPTRPSKKKGASEAAPPAPKDDADDGS